MNNEMEQKKIYEAPAMEEVEFLHKGNLLEEGSPTDDTPSASVEFN